MNDILLQAWRELETVVPLTTDCGAVCDGRCCRPSEQSGGMLLFPGEELLLQGQTGFTVQKTPAGTLLTCAGRCDRAMRPLACRMFPLFPLVEKDGRIRAVYDPRGWRECPLVNQSDRVPLRRDFVRAVRRVGRLLMQDPACAAFLIEQSEDIRMLTALTPLAKGRSPIMRRKIR